MLDHKNISKDFIPKISEPTTTKMHASEVGQWDVRNITVIDDKAICINPVSKIISVWNFKTNEHIKSWNTDSSVWSSVQTNNGELVTGHGGLNAEDNVVIVWNIEKVKPIKKLFGHTDSVISLKITADNKIVSASVDGFIRIWDLETESCVLKLAAHPESSVRAIHVTANGLLVSAGNDERMKIWNLKNGECIKTFEKVGWIHAMTETKTGLIVTGHSPEIKDDITMQVWDIDKGVCLQEKVKGHTASIQNLITTPDGTIVSSSIDKTVKVWDISEKQAFCLKTIIASDSTYAIGTTDAGFITCNNQYKLLENYKISAEKNMLISTMFFSKKEEILSNDTQKEKPLTKGLEI